MDKLSNMQDKELVALFKEGSQLAFEALYIRYKKKLTYFCKSLLRDENRAEDIAHDVFLQVFETYYGLNPELSFYGYLQTIAHNRITNEVKRFDVHLRYAQNIIKHWNDATNQTEDMIIDNDYEKLLCGMIDSLSPQQKEVFRLSRIQGLTYNEIAELLHLTLRTVQKHASLALEKIKKQLLLHADLHFKTVITFVIFFS
jgi:RNA polymerase sigma-70 factor (ECF subfamily)